MTPDQLKHGFVTLNKLAESEYRKDLQQLLTDPQPDVDPAEKIGRLVGVLLKQPFAIPKDLNQPSTYTGAYRSWELLDEEAFNDPSRTGSWQYHVLQQLAAETAQQSVYGLALEAHHERGFFGYLARSTAKYLCGDTKIQKEVKEAVDDAKKAGINVSVTSPDVVVGSAGLSIGMLLIQYVPMLGFVGAPVIAGLTLIIYRIGIDAFCDWSKSHRTNEPVERM